MVIASSTQWTIPLAAMSSITDSSSSSSASALGILKNGSLLGLKTWQLPASPASSSLADHHDQELRSTSSRRLQDSLFGTDTMLLASRRSAGSFRQLINDQELSIRNIEQQDEDGYDASYHSDGIAIPWSSHNSCNLNSHIGAMKKAGHGVADHLQGEITADDVDLLPMPSLFMSCSSPVYESVFPSYAMAASEITSMPFPETSANSSKSHVPTNMRSKHPGPCTWDNGTGATSSVWTAMNGKHNDGLWSCNGSDPIRMLRDDSHSLASVFSIFPQSFYGFRTSKSDANNCIVISNFPVDDNDELQNLLVTDNTVQKAQVSTECVLLNRDESQPFGMNIMLMQAARSAKVHGSPQTAITIPLSQLNRSYGPQVSHGPNTSDELNVAENSMIFPNMDTASSFSPIRTESEFKSAKSRGPNTSDELNVAENSMIFPNMDTSSSFSPIRTESEFKSAKRPFSMLQAPAMSVTSYSSVALNSWKSQEDYTCLAHRTMLHKPEKNSQHGDDVHHRIAARDSVSALEEENLELKPPPIKMRRTRGMAMDPHSIAARNRREKFSERIRTLQSLVPNGERLDTVSMLGRTLEYVRFLQHQVWQLYHGKDPDNACEGKWKDFTGAAITSTNKDL